MSGILILGGAGRLGCELDKTLHQLGARNVVAASRAEADAADPASVLKLSNRFPGGRPNWVVCAAAWSDVPRAEVDKTGAFRGNVLAPRGAALAAAHWDAPLLHYSSDYVFSGGGRRLLHSDLRPKPQGAYGRTKLDGEREVLRITRKALGKALIVRAGWLYSEATGEGFPKKVLERALSGKPITMRTNQFGRPSSYESLAFWSASMMLGGAESSLEKGVPEVLHFAPPGETVSRYALAKRILSRAAEVSEKQGSGLDIFFTNALIGMKGFRAHQKSQPENCRLSCEQLAFFNASYCYSWQESVDKSVDNFLLPRFAIGETQD